MKLSKAENLWGRLHNARFIMIEEGEDERVIEIDRIRERGLQELVASHRNLDVLLYRIKEILDLESSERVIELKWFLLDIYGWMNVYHYLFADNETRTDNQKGAGSNQRSTEMDSG